MNLSEALELIELYVESLRNEELNDEFRKQTVVMLEWLREYGCNDTQIRQADSIVQQYTGYRLAEIQSLDRAGIVKEALYGVVNSEYLGRRRQPDEVTDSAKWALDNVDFGFGGDHDPIDAYEDEP
jgi:hypothetical protein